VLNNSQLGLEVLRNAYEKHLAWQEQQAQVIQSTSKS